MRKPWQIWLAFCAALAVVLTAMAWMSLTALHLERAGAEARKHARMEGKVRLALWRMDSALAPLLAEEGRRPYFAYSAFRPAERAYTRMFAPIQPDNVLLASPLLGWLPEHVRLHFQFDPDGVLTSPQAPEDNMLDLAWGRGYIDEEEVKAMTGCRDTLGRLVDREALLARLPTTREERPVAMVLPGATAQVFQEAAQPGAEQAQSDLQQKAFNAAEWQARWSQVRGEQQGKPVRRTTGKRADEPDGEPAATGKGGPPLPEVKEGALQPLWLRGELLLARRVEVNGREFVQGCWLDWPSLRKSLLARAAELLPGAELVPVQPRAEMDPSRMLAALPVRLAPGEPAVRRAASAGMGPLHMMLAAAWAGVLLAGAAVAVLLRGAVSLSERRGAFVSAVTHELRTPLTTFQMYTEMLAGGMVTDEQRKAEYLQTLKTEADRLGHLVANVLAYAALENGAGVAHVQRVGVGELLERVAGRLRERAEGAGMTLAVDAGGAGDATVRADVQAVEQVLFNLVDNACKYAAGADDRRIHLEAEIADGMAAIRVRDHGRGVPREEGERIFRAFRKSAREAAERGPGVGLGLALSRRLARSLRGDLRLEDRTDGASFVLTLPLEG